MNIYYLRSNGVDPDPRVEKEVDSLISQGFKVNILAWDRSGEKEKKRKIQLKNGGVEVLSFQLMASYGDGFKKILKLLAFQIFLLFHLVRNFKRIDVVHAADFDTVLPAVLMRIFFRKKVIYDVFDFYVDAFSVPNKIKWLIKRVDIWVMGFVDAVIITSESRVNQIDGVKPKKLIIIHNSPNIIGEVDGSRYKKENYKFNISYVGVLQNGRFIPELLDVVSRDKSIRLLIAGFGQLEDKVLQFSGKFKNIEFFGKVDYSESLAISAASEYMIAVYDPVIPNHRYSSPNKLYEAMALGKPIIVGNNTSVDDIVISENIGFSIDYTEEDFIKIVEKLKKINSREYQEISRNCKISYSEKYSWSAMNKQLIGLYRSL